MSAAPSLRLRLYSSTAVALALIGTAMPASAFKASTAFDGTAVVTSGTAAIDRSVPNFDKVTVGNALNSTAIITWTPNDTTGTGPVNFMAAGQTAIFTNAPGLTDFTVVNRVLPVDGQGIATNRAVAYNGTITSQITNDGVTTPGGTVVFYTPGGIIVGPTASINVGNLLLTTADPVLTASGFALNSATGSTSTVRIAKGAQVNAQNNYVALVAPRIQQDGTVAVAGGAAYVAAEQVDLTILGAGLGLFDIKIAAGSAKGSGEAAPFTALSHTGTTTGTTPAGGTNPTIVLAAIPKNDAITMLVGGTVGFTPATGATVSAGTVELFAGVPSAENAARIISPVTIGPNANVDTSVVANLGISASTTTNLYAEAATLLRLAPSFSGQTALTQTLTGSVALLGRSQTSLDTAGSNGIAIGGNLTLGSNGSGDARGVSIDAAGGTVTIGGNLFANLVSHGFKAPQVGLAIDVAVTGGGKLSVAGTSVLTASAVAEEGQGQGGTINVLVDTGGQISSGALTLDTSGRGNAGTGGAGGSAAIRVNGSGTLVAGDVFITADGISNFGSTRQIGQGGSTTFALGTGSSANLSSLSLSAVGRGPGQGKGGTAALTIDAGAFGLTLANGAGLDASGYGQAAAGAVGGDGIGGTARATVAGGFLTLASSNPLTLTASGAGGGGSTSNATDGTPGFDGGAGKGGTASFALTGGAATLPGVAAVAAGNGGSGGGGSFNGSGVGGAGGAGGLGRGGTATVAVGGSTTVLAVADSGLLVDASGFGGRGGNGGRQLGSPPDTQGAAGGAGGAGGGGSASVLVNLGGKILGQQVGGPISVTASGTAAAGTSGGYGTVASGAAGAGGLFATGGTALLTIDGGTIDNGVGALLIDAGAATAGGVGTGGSAAVALTNGAALRVSTVTLTARATGRVLTSVTGGSATIRLDGSGLTAAEVVVDAGSTSFGPPTSSPAVFTGGTAALDMGASGSVNVNSLNFAANADAGEVTVSPGQIAPSAVGGTARLTMAPGNATVTTAALTLSANARGGNAVSGRGGTGVAGAATGGSATVMVGGGSLTNSGNSLTTLYAVATGGTGFQPNNAGENGEAGVAGGTATGGTTAFNVGGAGQVTLAALNLASDAIAGAGGAGSFSLNGTAGAGGAGGNAVAGTARVSVTNGAKLALVGQPAEGLPPPVASAIAVAGTGGDGGSIGVPESSPPFTQGVGGAGGAGGTAKGGVASVVVDSNGALSTMTDLLLVAHSTSGAGGIGGRGNQDNAVNDPSPGADAVGGAFAQGGTATVTVANGAMLTGGQSISVESRSTGFGASSLGGNVGVIILGGGVAVRDVTLAADASAQTGGTATGGSAILTLNSGPAMLPGSLTANDVSASATAGDIFSSAVYTPTSSATGGLAAFDLGSAGKANINRLRLTAGGDAGFGPAGATGQGGTARLTLATGTAVLGVSTSIGLSATGAGGGGGTTGAAGAGRGGTAVATISGGTLTLASGGLAATLSTDAIGGTSALATSFVDGGTAFGGTSRFDVSGAANVSLPNLTLTAIATGGDGAVGVVRPANVAAIGGTGGTATAGTAAFNAGGTAVVNIDAALTLTATATGGRGGRGADGVIGAAGMPGIAAVTGGSVPLAGGSGGAGGNGSSGGVGGAAIGGQTVLMTNSAPGVGNRLTVGGVALASIATAGGGGDGGMGGAGGVGGPGGAGVNGGADGATGASGAAGGGGLGGQGGTVTGGSTMVALANGTFISGGTSLDATVVATIGGAGGADGNGSASGLFAAPGALFGGPGARLTMSGVQAAALGAQASIAAYGPVVISSGASDRGFTAGSLAARSATSIVSNAPLAVTSATFTGNNIFGVNVPVSIGGAIVAGTVAIQTSGAVAIDAPVTAISLVAQSGSSIESSATLATDTLNLTTLGTSAPITLTGTTVARTATISAPGAVRIDGSLTGAAGSNFQIYSSTSIAATKALSADFLSLTGYGAGATIALTGPTTAAIKAGISTPGAVTLGGPLTAGTLIADSNTSITATGALIVTGDATLSGNAGTGASVTIAAPGYLQAGGNVDISASGAVSVGGNVSGAALKLRSDTSVAATSRLIGNSLTINQTAPGATIALTGSSLIAGATLLTTPGSITLGGVQQSASLAATSPTGIVVTGAVTAASGATTLTGAGGTMAGVTVTPSGSLTGQAITVVAPGAIKVDGGIAGTTVALSSDTAMTASGLLSAATLAVTGTAPNATIALTGIATVSSAMTVTAPGAVQLAGQFLGGGSLTASSATSLNVAYAQLNASVLTLTATAPSTTLRLGGTSSVVGAIKLTAATLVTIDGVQRAGMFTAASDTGIAVTGAVNASDIVLTGNANTNATVDVAATGRIAGTTRATITAPGAVTLAGAVTAPTLAVTSGTSIASSGVLGGNAVTLTGAGPVSTITLTGTLNDTGTAAINAPGTVALSGMFTGGGALTASSNTRVTLGFGQLAASALTLTATSPGGVVALGGNTTVSGATRINTPGALTVSGVQQAGTFTAESANAISVTGSVAATDIILTGTPGTAATVGVLATGSLAGSNSVGIAAPSAVTFAGTVTAPSVSVASAAGIVASGTLGATTLALSGTSPGATISLAGVSTVAGATTLSAPGAINIAGTHTAGNFSAASDRTIGVTGSVAATDVVLTGNPSSGGSVSIAPSGVVTAVNTATITAPGTVQLDGAVTARTLTVASGFGVAGAGALRATTLGIVGTNSAAVLLNGSQVVTGAATIQTPGQVALTGAFTGGGSLDVSSANSVTVNDTMLNARALTLTATAPGTTVNLGGVSTVTGATRLTSPQSVTVSGSHTAGTFTTVAGLSTVVRGAIAAGDVVLSGGTGTSAVVIAPGAPVTALNSVTIAAAGNLDLGGAITAPTISLTSGSVVGTRSTGLLTATNLTATGTAPNAPITLLGGMNVSGTAALATPGIVTVGIVGNPNTRPVTARTLTISGASAVELAAPITATDVAITGVDGVTSVTVDAPVHVANSFGVAHAASFTNNALIDPADITIDVSGLITVNGLLQADRVTLDSGDIAILSGGVQATSLAEFLTSAVKTSAATVGGTGDNTGYTLDAGELSRVAANRIVVSTGPLASNHSSSGGGTNRPLDLAVQTLSLVGSSGANANLNGGPNAALALAASGALNVGGRVSLTSAGTTDAVVLATAGPVSVVTPSGGAAITDANGAATGELYAYGSQFVAASRATATKLATTPAFADKAALLRINDGPVAPAGYLIAGRIEVRTTSGFYAQNSGTAATFAGLTTGDGGLGIRAGAIADGAVIGAGGLASLGTVDGLDTYLGQSKGTDVIGYGRQITSKGTIVTNDAFAKIVRTTTNDVTPQSTVNDCPVPGIFCGPNGGAYQGAPVVGQGSATFARSGSTNGDGVDVITIGASGGIVITWTPFDTAGTGPVDFLPKGNSATFIGATGVGSYTVINRVLPTDATRAVVFNGTTISRLTGTNGLATPGGTVVFFAPGGIVVGPTGVFDVGSLVLTTADPQMLGGGFRFNSAPGSTAGVTIAPGASITASTVGGFVDLVAPRVRQNGTVTVNGDAVYVAAEQADVTANADGSTVVVLSRGAQVGSDPLLLEHTGVTTGSSAAPAGANIVLAAIGRNAPALVQVGGTLGYAGGSGTVTIAAGNPVGVVGLTASGVATPTDLRLASGSATSALVAQASRNLTVTAPVPASARFGGPVSLAFGGDLAIIGALTAPSLTATGTGTASAISITAPVTAPVTSLTTTGAITLAAPITAVTSLTVSTPRLLTITSAVDPATISFTVGDIAISPTGRVGDANTQLITIQTDGALASSATLGGLAGAGGFDLDASEYGRLQANRILISTGLGTTTHPLDLHIGPLTVAGSAATGNLNPDGVTPPAATFASSANLYVDGPLALANAGATDTLGLLAAGRVIVTLPIGSIGVTTPDGALGGRLYLLGGDIIAGSTATQATVAAASTFDGRRSALGLNDGAVNDGGYIRAASVDVRAATSFRTQNSGSNGLYAGIAVGTGGLGFRQGVLAAGNGLDLTNATAVDAALRSTGSAEVIAFGLQRAKAGAIVNAAFLPTVRVVATDVTLQSEITGCVVRGGTCRDPRGDGTALDRAAQLAGEVVRPAEEIVRRGVDAAADSDSAIAAETLTFAVPRLVDLSAATITGGIGDPATGAGDESMWDPLGPDGPDLGPQPGGADGRVGKRPVVRPVVPTGGSASR